MWRIGGSVEGGNQRPGRVFDQLAVMRVAELIRDGRVKQVIAEAIKEQGGNGGCSALEAGFLFGKRKR